MPSTRPRRAPKATVSATAVEEPDGTERACASVDEGSVTQRSSAPCASGGLVSEVDERMEEVAAPRRPRASAPKRATTSTPAAGECAPPRECAAVGDVKAPTTTPSSAPAQHANAAGAEAADGAQPAAAGEVAREAQLASSDGGTGHGEDALMPSSLEITLGMEPPPRTTSKLPLPESSTIRKSPHGRAILYIDDANYQELRCSSSVAQHRDTSVIYHSHAVNQRLPATWRESTTIACWHCCHRFEGPPVPVARSYDAKEQKFVVFGNFCTLSCAKAWMVDSPSFDSAQRINIFAKMARDVYGEVEVLRAPPRVSLDLFGGPYSIDEFRARSGVVTLLTAPFITSYMVVEERKQVANAASYEVDARGSVRGLRRPAQPVPMIKPAPIPYEDVPYVKFAAAKQQAAASSSAPAATSPASEAAAPPTRPAPPPAPQAVAGTLKAFFM